MMSSAIYLNLLFLIFPYVCLIIFHTKIKIREFSSGKLPVRRQVDHQVYSLVHFGFQTQFFSDICPMKVHGFFWIPPAFWLFPRLLCLP